MEYECLFEAPCDKNFDPLLSQDGRLVLIHVRRPAYYGFLVTEVIDTTKNNAIRWQLTTEFLQHHIRCLLNDGRIVYSDRSNTITVVSQLPNYQEIDYSVGLYWLGHESKPTFFLTSPSGSFIICHADVYHIIFVMDTRTWKCVYHQKHCYGVKKQRFAFTSDDKFLSYSTMYGAVIIRETEKWTSVRLLKCDYSTVIAVTYSADNRYLTVGSTRGILKIWDTSSWYCIQTMNCETIGSDYQLVFSSRGRLIASGRNGTWSVWDTSKAGFMLQFDNTCEHPIHLCNVQFSPQGDTIRIPCTKGILRLLCSDIVLALLISHILVIGSSSSSSSKDNRSCFYHLIRQSEIKDPRLFLLVADFLYGSDERKIKRRTLQESLRLIDEQE